MPIAPRPNRTAGHPQAGGETAGAMGILKGKNEKHS